jgi:hypothetical protein
MNEKEAKSIAKSRDFKKSEIREILVIARKKFKKWKTPNPVNPLFTYGSIFNSMVEWIEGYDDDFIVPKHLVVSVLWCFGKYVNIQPSQKKGFIAVIIHSAPVKYE